MNVGMFKPNDLALMSKSKPKSIGYGCPDFSDPALSFGDAGRLIGDTTRCADILIDHEKIDSELSTASILLRVRRCFLFGVDPFTGNNHDHRKFWIEDQFKPVAANFGIDLLSFAILSNHFRLILS